MRTPVMVLLSLCLLSGCAKYVTPGRAAEMGALGAPRTDFEIDQVLKLRPAATFPTGVAVARVQASGYQAYHTSTYGEGDYCLVTSRNAESDDLLQRLQKLPRVSGVAPLSRLLVSPTLRGNMPLRQAAAALHADMLLIYTLDTVYSKEGVLEPLSVVTLGVAPNRVVRMSTSASGLLVDTRTGYVYATGEGLAQRKQAASAWTSKDAADQSRRKTEAEALEKLLSSFEKSWPVLLAHYDRPAPVSAASR